jgi:streptomycin 6-kinase
LTYSEPCDQAGVVSADAVPPWINEAWLASVPFRLDLCAKRWRVNVGERMGHGNTSRVFRCTDDGGHEFVLKLAPTEMRPDVEAAALRAWDGCGSVRLLAFEPEAGGLLMERITPGTPLPPFDDAVATDLVAPTLSALHRARVDGTAAFPDQLEFLDVWLSWVRTSGENGTAGMRLLEQAYRRARSLCFDRTRLVLLHGDFIDKNLLLGDEGYVAVDPIPRIGDPCSDVGFYAAYHPPADNIARRARVLARNCGLDPERAASWAAVWAVGEATETWRSDSDELQRWVQGDEATQLLAL